MGKHNLKLYLSFIASFLVMHYTGAALVKLPYLFNALIVSGVVFIVILFFSKVVHGENLKTTCRNTGLLQPNIPGLAPGVFVSATLLCAYPLIGSILHAEIRLADNWYWNLIGLVFTAGIAEELLFRGYLFGSLQRNMSFVKATKISAVCFTLAHLFMFAYIDWSVALLSTLLAITSSLPLAFLYVKGKNTIWSPAFVHITIRTIGLVFTTDESHFTQLFMLWIPACMVLPYLTLAFFKEFRVIFNKKL